MWDSGRWEGSGEGLRGCRAAKGSEVTLWWGGGGGGAETNRHISHRQGILRNALFTHPTSGSGRPQGAESVPDCLDDNTTTTTDNNSNSNNRHF